MVSNNIKKLDNVKNIIAIVSGKGGVGKSTISVNIALALTKLGANVGILDADIYGPSIPLLLGVKDSKNILDNNKINPIQAHGLQINSIGFFIDEESPVMWRGPMASKCLEQLLYLTTWQNIDYLILDMPPGTGDISISLISALPKVTSIIITTSQNIALSDVNKSMLMMKKFNIPMLGVIENMSNFKCAYCGNSENIFSKNGGQFISKKYNVDLLGNIPFSIEMMKNLDNGIIESCNNVDNEISSIFLNIAKKIVNKLSILNNLEQEKNHSKEGKIPIFFKKMYKSK
ncbi:Iron-sulfur cluster carrier protein [Candidatus Kinetoplastibacterium sorsogonicusi]|uniref:Iron-sulfur cluster carrier protein n=1 Tax=Candidatus Kinetoplastidibacterium kentomonadis TaxID=1576550 RepID=A0A3Q8ER07_9PROT|nr:Mrp/NBP35 family ATP-binding protein [Candidatus Kinetoplastibacterium sorsogonicusi]AWD32227.1 Iron-sulfur cluster carrier protein [Candidatus Kinetoplastibacterium sorsogonicusi]